YTISEARTPLPVSEGVTESFVRSSPYTVHGWRPTSVVTQPAITATNPSGDAISHSLWNQRERSSSPRAQTHQLHRVSASIARPMPTISRNEKNGIATGGRSSGFHSL